MKMKCVVLVFAMLMVSCGNHVDIVTPGLYGDAPALVAMDAMDLLGEFEDVKKCMGIQYGGFDDLAIVGIDGTFDCFGRINTGCFYEPNLIKFDTNSMPWLFRHEIIHYLIYSNTGNSDGNHESEMFYDCRGPFVYWNDKGN